MFNFNIKYFVDRMLMVASILSCALFTTVEAEFKEKDLRIMSELYDFRGPIFLKTLQGGVVNAPTYLYTIKDGIEVGLGVFKREASEELANKRFMVLEKMKRNGFLYLPKIIKNINGLYLSNINGGNYSCFEYLPPDLNVPNLSLFQMLEAIGKFHAFSRYCSHAQELRVDVMKNYKNRLSYFSDSLLKEYDPGVFDTEIWKQIIMLSEYYASAHFEKIYNTLPMQIIHGDPHYKNFVISNGNSYFIDFDLMHYGTRLWDLSCCITFAYYSDFLEMIENGTFFSFLESSYGKAGIELEDSEKRYFIEVMKLRELEGGSWVLEQMRQALNDHNTERYEMFREYLLRKIIKLEKLINLQALTR